MHVCAGCASGEGCWLAEGRLRDGDDFGAVDEVARIVADNGELSHGGLEVAHHELLVVDHALPRAGGTEVAGERKVGLETHLSRLGDRRVDLRAVGVVDTEWDARALEQDLEEDLGVESERRRVERDGLVSGDERVGTRDGVRGEQVDQLRGGEATVLHALQDRRDVALGEGDGAVVGGERRIRSASQELQAWCARAVGDTDRAGELDEVTSGHKVTREERRQGIDGVINTIVRSKGGLDGREKDHRPISSGTLELARLGEANGVVEGETKRLMSVLSTFAVEEVVLEIIPQSEERAALSRIQKKERRDTDINIFVVQGKREERKRTYSFVGCEVHAIGASNALDVGRSDGGSESNESSGELEDHG